MDELRIPPQGTELLHEGEEETLKDLSKGDVVRLIALKNRLLQLLYREGTEAGHSQPGDGDVEETIPMPLNTSRVQ